MKFNAQLVTTFELTKAGEVCVYYDFFNGRVWANIRKFAKSDRYTGPTSDGVKFDPTFLPDIIAALHKADAKRDSMSDEVFLRLPKNKSRDLVVHASSYKGTVGIDLRETFRTASGEEKWGKGIRLRLEFLTELIGAVTLMNETKPQVEELGAQASLSAAPETNVKSPEVEGVPDALKRLFIEEENDD